MVDLTSLDVIEQQELFGWTRLTVRVPHLDARGDPRVARGHLWLPPALLAGEVDRAPLLHVAGYEIFAGVGALTLPWWMEHGMVIVNPVTPVGEEVWPGDNALARGVNLDRALHHLARSLPFVDDRRVIVTGQSAGGYTSLLVAADAFPVAGVAPDVCPLDMGSIARHLLRKHEVTPRPELVAVIGQAMTVMGDDTTSPTWRAHAPIERRHEITAPVSMVLSTADTLIPIEELDPLLAVLDPGAVGHHRVPIPTTLTEIRVGEPVPPDGWTWLDIPDSPAQWNVVVLDEGPRELWIDHLRHATLFRRGAFFDRVLAEPVAVDQLTPAKLARLVDRWLGVEWAPPVRHLDTPENERADVLRGIRTYAGEGAAHRARYRELYAALPADRQLPYLAPSALGV